VSQARGCSAAGRASLPVVGGARRQVSVATRSGLGSWSFLRAATSPSHWPRVPSRGQRHGLARRGWRALGCQRAGRSAPSVSGPRYRSGGRPRPSRCQPWQGGKRPGARPAQGARAAGPPGHERRRGRSTIREGSRERKSGGRSRPRPAQHRAAIRTGANREFQEICWTQLGRQTAQAIEPAYQVGCTQAQDRRRAAERAPGGREGSSLDSWPSGRYRPREGRGEPPRCSATEGTLCDTLTGAERGGGYHG